MQRCLAYERDEYEQYRADHPTHPAEASCSETVMRRQDLVDTGLLLLERIAFGGVLLLLAAIVWRAFVEWS